MAAYYNEIDRYAAQWLRNLIDAGVIAPGDVDERDIRDVRPGDLAGYTQCHFFAGIGVWSYALRRAGWPDDRPVWTGSCPCQPFSAAGRGAGFADERHLWPAWFHLIRVCRPDVVFGEQVASKDGLLWLDLVQDDLQGESYAVGALDSCSAGVGAPHIRQRLGFVSHSDDPERRAERAQWHYGDGAATGRVQSDGDAAERGSVGRLDHHHQRSHGQQAGLECSRWVESQDPGFAGELGHHHQGLSIGSVEAQFGRPLRFQGAAIGAANPLRGFWERADWIWHRDGKYRPVEPGSFPLADGAPARVGRLRAYGNAINAEDFAGRIRDYLDAEAAGFADGLGAGGLEDLVG